MRPLYSRPVRVRKDILGIVAHAQREWVHGNPLSIAEIHAAIETRIDEEISAAVQDAISEIRRDE
jgi:hypothetical protein